MIIEIAEELFEQLGYKVLTARSGKEAIVTYEKNKNRIEIVLLDMIMPDMSGSDTYDRMKELSQKLREVLDKKSDLICGFFCQRRMEECLYKVQVGFSLQKV